MQRLINGMHLLALLAGIYLMIFVVEPVAVPHHFLSQHYYGIPWGADRRTHRDFSNLPHLRRNSILQSSISRDDKNKILPHVPVNNGPRLGMPLPPQTAPNKRIPGNQPPQPLYYHPSNNRNNNSKKDNISKSSVPSSLTATSKVRYISADDLYKRKNATNTGKIRHWSKWIPPRNSTDESSSPAKISNRSDWSPSITVISRDDSSKDAERKIYSSTGSAESLSLFDIRN